jgi:hypothetical protein
MSDSSPPSSDFEEAYYLRTNPDVAEAVKSGIFATGWAHYLAAGRAEGRPGSPSSSAVIAAEVAKLNHAVVAGRKCASELEWTRAGNAESAESSSAPTRSAGRLMQFFEQRTEGRGIWKWRHYFEIYEHHLARFRGHAPSVLEIGVYSGGSFDLWSDYFGPGAKLYGVDLEPACAAYANEQIRIFTGDQADRKFWGSFRQNVPVLEVVIDDGGHRFEQQAVTLEELLPHLRPGGVYICEDIHGENHAFSSYVGGLVNSLNAGAVKDDLENNERRLVSSATPFQSAIASISCYPMMVVIEKRSVSVTEFVASKHGSQWEPHLQ